MHARFLGKDPDSHIDGSPALFSTDRTDRKTYIAQGWTVTDPQAVADVGPVPPHEGLIEIPAGEDIRYLTRNQAEEIGLPDHDYWLFDSRKLVRMHFDENDRLLGGEVIEDLSEIVQHNYWRDAAWHHAVERGDFATEQGVGRIERP